MYDILKKKRGTGRADEIASTTENFKYSREVSNKFLIYENHVIKYLPLILVNVVTPMIVACFFCLFLELSLQARDINQLIKHLKGILKMLKFYLSMNFSHLQSLAQQIIIVIKNIIPKTERAKILKTATFLLYLEDFLHNTIE